MASEPTPPTAPASPADLWPELLADVQMRRLFGDGKTFADAVPRAPAAEIAAAHRALPRDDHALAEFVDRHFAIPQPAEVPDARVGGLLRPHIRALWSELERGPDPQQAHGSALELPYRYVVPGGRFRELYYWDSYFAMLGLVRDGHRDLAEQMLDAFTDLIERYGHVPNGARTYYLGRSQPPFYAMMVELLPHPDPQVTRRRLKAMIAEHAFWTAGAEGLTPGAARGRSVAMPDGSILSRYWDPRDTPRDESFREDVDAAAAAPTRAPGEVFRDIRAGAESGWDFSSRWLGEARAMPAIRTTCIVPIDLNAYLFRLEHVIARTARDLHAPALVERFRLLARARQQSVARHLWSEEIGAFVDWDLAYGPQHRATAAALAPLFVGMASREEARRTARMVVRCLLALGGLRTTLTQTGEQWDAPNGWAPLQWIAFVGLDRYRHHRLARTIAERWSAMVRADFDRTGWLHEKYDVERCVAGQGGEYVPQHGFGWTNGVTAAFLDLLEEGAG